MLMLQSRQDVEKAVELVNEALVIDEKCDFAYETLATLEVQRYVNYKKSYNTVEPLVINVPKSQKRWSCRGFV